MTPSTLYRPGFGFLSALCVTFIALADQEPRSLHSLLQAPHSRAASYPDVVARVNDENITGQQIAMRERIIGATTENGSDTANLRQIALGQLISEVVLLQAARESRITLRDSEVIDRIEEMQRLARTVPTDDTFATAAGHVGIKETDYATDPRVIAMYRRGFVLGMIRSRIIEGLPENQRDDPKAVQRAIDRFVAARAPRVETSVIR